MVTSSTMTPTLPMLVTTTAAIVAPGFLPENAVRWENVRPLAPESGSSSLAQLHATESATRAYFAAPPTDRRVRAAAVATLVNTEGVDALDRVLDVIARVHSDDRIVSSAFLLGVIGRDPLEGRSHAEVERLPSDVRAAAMLATLQAGTPGGTLSVIAMLLRPDSSEHLRLDAAFALAHGPEQSLAQQFLRAAFRNAHTDRLRLRLAEYLADLEDQGDAKEQT